MHLAAIRVQTSPAMVGPPRAPPSAVSGAPAVPSPSFVQGAVCGGLAAMGASACTHPLDLFKVRLQLAGELDGSARRPSLVRTFRHMVASEGVGGFYRGLSASLVRQALYSPARFGLFQILINQRLLAVTPASAAAPPGTMEKLVASLLAGAFGGALSSPADLVMVRMQADGRLHASAQRKYGGILGGVSAVVREGGLPGLWRGTAPNVQRAMITTCAQFTSYDYFKRLCSTALHLPDGLLLHFVSSMMAGVVVATCASPMDVLRTRMMNSKKATRGDTQTTHAKVPQAMATGAAPTAPLTTAYARAYTSTFDCVVQTFRSEGVRGFYKGFLPYYARVAPQVTLMFVFYEQLQTTYRAMIK